MKVIKIQVDLSCEMARVSIDGKGVMEGNFWDFHPGCHAINEYGDFEGHDDLATVIGESLRKNGYVVETLRESYKYEY
jgi:hypothetical protein